MGALLLAPTRELAIQIQKVCLSLGDYVKIRCHACIGGTSVREDIDKLRNGQQLVVGTPGRVNDMAGKGHLRLDDCLIFVLDEADEMLSRGFKAHPPSVQVALFSATMPPDILDLTSKFMRDPI